MDIKRFLKFLKPKYKCPKCGKKKTLDQVGVRIKDKGLMQAQCKDCFNKYRRDNYIRDKERDKGYKLKKLFGITTEDYNRMFDIQGGKCAICNEEERAVRKKKTHGVGNSVTKLSLSVDHDHKTNKVRGLLCGNCNTGIGKFYEDINKLKNAVKYLEERNG